MIIIREGLKPVKKMLSMIPGKGRLYRLSRCVLQEQIPEGTLLCNTITGELMLLSHDETHAVEQLPGTLPEVLNNLVMDSLVVPVDYNEELIVKQLRTIVKKSSGNYYRHFVILPTTHCNARCFYCYESDLVKTHMSIADADKLTDFIESHYDGKLVTLSWFGGEPLIGKARIDHICKGLERRGVSYQSTMTSNGYLFDRELVEHAVESWKLSVIQITLDGTEKIYNKTKAYVGAADNPYERVIRNIIYLLEKGVKLNLRLNLDKHNRDDLLELIDELDNRIKDKRYLSTYVSLINGEVGYAPLDHEPGEIEALREYAVELEDILKSRNLARKFERLPHLTLSSCMADDDSELLCTPDGILSKCEDQAYSHSVGTLDDGVVNTDEIRWWKERICFPECGTCPLIGACIKLKHCPANGSKCIPLEREQKIKRYKTVMKELYYSGKKQKN